MSGPRLLTGWGRTAATAAANVAQPQRSEVSDLLIHGRQSGRGVIARGLGRSYGDPAQNAGGLVLDMTAASAVLSFDAEAGIVRAEAGVSLDVLMRVLLPCGWFLPVTPGTRYVTVGGAIAADVHGKNHHRDGSFGRYVEQLTLALADGTTVDLTPESDPELFWATVGGMGLTGIILEATIRLTPAPTSTMLVDTQRAKDLDELLGALEDADRHRYSVAWLDCLARGRQLGRGVVTSGEHATLDADRDAAGQRVFGATARLTVPTHLPGLLGRPSIAAFNLAWYAKAPRRRVEEVQGISTFFHPLDGVRGWNNVYGPAGFLQYQCLVPDETTLRTILTRIGDARAPSFLTVLKRLGAGTPGPLSFPRPGWTLTLDFPASTTGLDQLLDGLDRLVAAAGGCIYLAKDSRVQPELMSAFYPKLDAWREIRDRIDPDHTLESDQSRRLSL
jgi:decaprenylphospho-beta-D-ribofuranose 2-oxidase